LTDFLARKDDFVRVNHCRKEWPNTSDGCRKPPPYNRFDWTDDGCTGRNELYGLGRGPSNIYRNIFNKPCQRHDFGYYNFGKGLALESTEDKRRRIDEIFLQDMLDVCETTFTKPWQVLNKNACIIEASALVTAVRHLGRPHFYGEGSGNTAENEGA
jgi:hypothetical protein